MVERKKNTQRGDGGACGLVHLYYNAVYLAINRRTTVEASRRVASLSRHCPVVDAMWTKSACAYHSAYGYFGNVYKLFC